MSHEGPKGRMSESSGAVASAGAVILEEVEVGTGGREQAPAPERGALRCGGCAVWPRQQTWLCVVPLLIGFIGLGLSLMLLKWIVVGSVKDYVPTDLVDAKGIGQDPIFLSKPSAFPKGSDTTTTSTTSSGISSSTPAVTMVTRSRTHSGTPPTNTTPRGGASGSQVTHRSTTTRFATRGPTFTTTTTISTTSTTSTSSHSPSNPTVLHDSTQTWTHDHSPEKSTTTPARTRINQKTPSPTLPPLHSEHFKPCQEKDLAYCLNDGECFVIETLSGPHKHCRCREGFQGIRCDQFLPKTDSILSDPTDHLGIEFMESKEVYKRQVLSIMCIAVGISLLGMLCMALYCRNKRRREKLQAHLKESRSLKNYSISSSGHKPSLRSHSNLQLQNYYKGTRSSPQPEGAVCESNFAQSSSAPSNHARPSTGRYNRSGCVTRSPDHRSRGALRVTPRRTPPIPRGRLNPIGGSKDSGPAYQHLQEMETAERDLDSVRGQAVRPSTDLRQDSFHNMQPSQGSVSGTSRAETQFSHLDPQSPSAIRALSNLPNQFSTTPYRTGSIPIIPSFHGHQDEPFCMQTTASTRSVPSHTPTERVLDVSPVNQQLTPSSKATEQNEVAQLLDEAQEQLRALAHAQRKQDDTYGNNLQQARETVCILLSSPSGLGGIASNGPTETQLVSPRDTQKDYTQPGQ
ncbi:pro-neuregulin-3, membrane-bound isoform [Chanos chanos]|uniref:Pro-neuregulin-3, membrane-bound isoform n=1 Tax=Chanos chanos TaxID=29144 RepID=A0A6J2V989_CHACN|nr:pro-neuregulin-3, membrane-bound isoform [Chanos chanos]